jgi:membrane protease subunit HflK
MLEKLQSQFRGLFANKQFPALWIFLAAILVLWLATGIYQVNSEEKGVVQRFGAYDRTMDPGLHWKWPSGIEKVTKVAVQRIYQEEFGFRTVRAGVRSEYAPEKPYEMESLMLTGDLNCVLVPWVVRYRISDPKQFLFHVRNVLQTLRDISESTMRLVVGDHSLDEVLTKREEISFLAQAALQKALDIAASGLKVDTIELGRTNVPAPVQPSFNEVNSSIQEKEKLIYEAQGAYNKVIPEAKGQAQKKVQEAEGYAVDRVKRAQGDASRFLALYQEYSKAKEVTRQRLYLEAMQEALGRLGKKFVIDEEQKGLLPLLNLGNKGGQP